MMKLMRTMMRFLAVSQKKFHRLLSLQRRCKTIFLNAIGLVLDIDHNVPTLRSYDCIRMFDVWNTLGRKLVKSKKDKREVILSRS